MGFGYFDTRIFSSLVPALLVCILWAAIAHWVWRLMDSSNRFFLLHIAGTLMGPVLVRPVLLSISGVVTGIALHLAVLHFQDAVRDFVQKIAVMANHSPVLDIETIHFPATQGLLGPGG